jgi:uncharacterized protein (TIGR02246 family)
MTARSHDDLSIAMLMERMQSAVRHRDLDGLMKLFAPEVVAYDMMPPLAQRGADAYRDHARAFLDRADGAVQCELKDLDVRTAADLAVAHCLVHVRFDARGEAVDQWMRWTAVLGRIDGHWRINHVHVSVPVHADGRAAVDLAP